MSENQPTSTPVCDEEMTDFPPLMTGVAGAVVCHDASGVAGNHRTEPPIPSAPSTAGPSAAAPPANAASWARTVSHTAKPMDVLGAAAPPDPNNGPRSETSAHSNVHRRQSMADALRTGQPAEGPIFLDREKAEKRGEIRHVDGKPCLYFSANETSLLAGRLGPAIVGKFSHSIPPAHQIQNALGKIKFFGTMSWNFLNAKHVYIQLSDNRDYVKLLNGPNNSPVWYIDHHPMRVFKWTPDFDPFFESPIVALWCNILALPVHLFEESALIAIGEMLGKPVQVDRPTIARTRVSFARICVEVDLSRPIPDEVDIDIAGKHVTLKVKWDKIPLYCHECKHVGHSAATCYASGKRPMPPKRDYSHGSQPMNRTPSTTQGVLGREGQPQPDRFAAGGRVATPQHQPGDSRGSVQPPSEVRQGYRSDGRPFDEDAAASAPGPSRGPSTTVSGVHTPQVTHADGFVGVKKKKKGKGKGKGKGQVAQRAQLETHRDDSLVSGSSSKKTPKGWDLSKVYADESPSEEVRRARSLSPSTRSGTEVGPLAMVLHSGNMFGALEDAASDEFDADSDDLLDDMVVEVPPWQLLSSDPVLQYTRHPSPPPEGSSKKARHSASDPPTPSHV